MSHFLRRLPAPAEIKAGLIVFMVALPLCVGISVASGVPATSGLLAAMVGGLLGSIVSGGHISINGPAAGMIAIVLAAVYELGQGDPAAGYRAMLACTVAAGALQVVAGWFRGGRLGQAFPSTVVHAMLAAIGVMIVARQAHVLFGVAPTASSPFGLIGEIPHTITNLNPAIAAIGVSGLTLMVAMTILTKKFSHLFLIRHLKWLPLPLLVVATGVALGFFFNLEQVHAIRFFSLEGVTGPQFLLAVPDSLRDAIVFPDFTVLTTPLGWKHVLMIFFVGSIESLLSASAVDRLDPQQRVTNLDRDLSGKGLCNMVSGSLGGLPIIAEIVRSSANASSGAQTQWSNFFHGFFLLLFVALVPGWLHLIPLASLAAVLVFVGASLARPAHFLHALEKGKDQGAVFVVTLLAILATDLLIGIIVGTALEFALSAWHARSINLFRLKVDEKCSGEQSHVLEIKGPVTFSNFMPLQSRMEKLGSVRRLTIDLRRSPGIDQTAMEHLTRVVQSSEKSERKVELLFSHHHVPRSSHASAARWVSFSGHND